MSRKSFRSSQELLGYVDDMTAEQARRALRRLVLHKRVGPSALATAIISAFRGTPDGQVTPEKFVLPDNRRASRSELEELYQWPKDLCVSFIEAAQDRRGPHNTNDVVLLANMRFPNRYVSLPLSERRRMKVLVGHLLALSQFDCKNRYSPSWGKTTSCWKILPEFKDTDSSALYDMYRGRVSVLLDRLVSERHDEVSFDTYI